MTAEEIAEFERARGRIPAGSFVAILTGWSNFWADPERYRVERCVADLVSVLDMLNVERAAVLGYSMGGRIALHLATAAPERVESLVLESASPGIADLAERQARIAADAALAESIEQDGVAAFVDRWARMPIFASQARLPVEVRARLRAQRIENRSIGLANSLREAGAGRPEPLWDRLAALLVRALVVAGDQDQKYCSIGSRVAEAMPAARLKIVANAGHAVHLEQPAEFNRIVLEFLNEDGRVAEGRLPARRGTEYDR